MISQFELDCSGKCPFKQDGVRPCGEGLKRKEEPCYTSIANLIKMIDDVRPELPVGFVDAVPILWHIAHVHLEMEKGEIYQYGAVVSGSYVPTELEEKK